MRKERAGEGKRNGASQAGVQGKALNVSQGFVL